MASTTPAFAKPRSPFELWSEVASSPSRGRRRLNARSLQSYQSIWSVFESFLHKHATPWDRVSPELAASFLENGIRSLGHGARAQDQALAQPSAVTQKRYWRVLHDIYGCAVLHRSVSENPFEREMARGYSENADALILPPHLLLQLLEGMEGELPDALQRVEKRWQPLRDLATLAFLLLSAAKVSEVCALRAADLHAQDTDALHGRRLATLTLGGASGLSERTFTPPRIAWSHRLWPFIDHWCAARLRVPGCSQWLFFGQKHLQQTSADLLAPTGAKLRGPLSEKSVFLLVAGAMERHIGPQASGHEFAHRGPQAIRNSVLSHWLQTGAPMEEVMRMAGMADPRAIARLDLSSR